ncbi:hypothetical protein O181_021940 [Austropuccinia psidii MF-1]|uniref:Uncharacterized protein n=1 Tax=Austropuccinia psidii MF-1 TaxID=1389203 RepID=A0A9Q3CFI6_9BASI|nr:hypothetical protein [Austropuccinia psidii MF-1]
MGCQHICRFSPTWAHKPEPHQHTLSIASHPSKCSAPMIPDTELFCTGTRHCGSYARHLHMHCGTFGSCLPANSHTFPPGIPVCVSPQEFLHPTKLMFGGMPPYIPHPPTQKVPTVKSPFPLHHCPEGHYTTINLGKIHLLFAVTTANMASGLQYATIQEAATTHPILNMLI